MEAMLFDFVDKSIILLFFAQVAILNFLNLSGMGIKVICILILVRFLIEIIIRKKIRITMVKNILALFAIFVIGYFSARLGHDYHKDIFASNYFAILYSVIPLTYVSHIINSRYLFLRRTINRSIGIINAYFAVNIVISCIQVKVQGFMSGLSTWENPMHEDLICGLMGYSATPQFGLFTIFVIVLNLYYADFCCIKYEMKSIFRMYSGLLVVFAVIISSLNDNKIMYIELPLVLLFYLCITKRLDGIFRKKVKKKTFNLFMLIGGIVLSVIVLYELVPAVHDKIYKNFAYSIELLIEATKSNAILGYGSAERVYMVIYAFTKYDALRLGYGMGAYSWHAGNALGFRHFGQADLGSFLCLAGLLFTGMICCLWMSNYTKIIYKNRVKSRVGCASVYLFFLMMVLYTQFISMNTISIIAIFCGAVFGLVSRKVNNDG